MIGSTLTRETSFFFWRNQMRHNTIRVLLFSLTVLLFVASPSVKAQEAPIVKVQPNAPGWISIYWEHTGEDVGYFVIERWEPPYTATPVLFAQSLNRTDSVIDKNLTANTTYKYHVCAVYEASRTCSDWVNATTLPTPPTPPQESPSGTTPPPVAAPELTVTRDQDPTHILLDWSGDPGWTPHGVGRGQTPLYKHHQIKQVVVYHGRLGNPKSTVILYDSLRYPGADNYPGAISDLSYTDLVRPNTDYAFKVCFITLNSNETKCSKEVAGSAKPAAPTAPVGVSLTQAMDIGNASDLTARIRSVLTARWTNTTIPGRQFILERQDKTQIDHLRLGGAWVEIKQVNDPVVPELTEMIVDTTRQELLTTRGNSYRVCAVVPSLGVAGKACSGGVSLPAK